MQIKADEISKIIEEEIQNYDQRDRHRPLHW